MRILNVLFFKKGKMAIASSRDESALKCQQQKVKR